MDWSRTRLSATTEESWRRSTETSSTRLSLVGSPYSALKGIILGEMLKPTPVEARDTAKGSAPVSRTTPKERSEKLKEKIAEADKAKAE